MNLAAQFSPCRTWRYTLTRRWSNLPLLVWLLLNPSTARVQRLAALGNGCLPQITEWIGRRIVEDYNLGA